MPSSVGGASLRPFPADHDNPTTREWFDAMPGDHRQAGWEYLKRPPEESGEVAWELIRLAWSSVAALEIALLQDLLNLGGEVRKNVPGRAEDNWRCSHEMLSPSAFERLGELTSSSGRSSVLRRPLASCASGTRRLPIGRP